MTDTTKEPRVLNRADFRDDFADRNEVHLSWVGDSATTMNVVWKTSDAATALGARIRETGAAEWQPVDSTVRTVVETGAVREAAFTELNPQGDYEYSVEIAAGAWTEAREFATAAPALQRFAFNVAFVADTGLVGRRDGLTNGTARVIQSIADYRPLVTLEGGDFAYYDTDRRFEYLEDAIDYFFNQMEPAFSVAPVQPTWGNHELMPFLQERIEPWLDRFATPDGRDDIHCYSFDVGHVHFVALSAWEMWEAIPQARIDWMIADIEDAQRRGFEWVIPYMHVAPFADGTNHPSNLELRAQLGPVFERLGIRVVLTTHDQAYERTFPLRDVPATNTPTTQALSGYGEGEGTVWVKVSPGGKMSNINKSFSTFANETAPAWTAVRSRTHHCWAKLEFADDGSLTIRIAGISGDPAEEEVVLDELKLFAAGS
ncbi:metallophosphoesterase family protein [Salinibacterium sp. ZJ454]|uniref:purple acid phosphatase family protein n=1 Tax=Salinibacterium sp. ZJ454 TaxID=2708339 RepID=UPI00142411E8|nr:metallophosphoesterase family protein [Salinibacterium sp. ZJ454]